MYMMRDIKMGLGAALIVWSMFYGAGVAHHSWAPPKEPPVAARAIYLDKQDATVMLLAAGAQGSGFFIDPHYIVTNAHVAEDVGTEVEIYHPDRGFTYGTTIYSNRKVDLAVVYTTTPAPDFYVLADYYPEIGQRVFNIGSPYSECNTLGEGQVTGIGRVAIVDGVFRAHLLQVNTGIAPGSSGSPIIDINGKVVAIVSMRVASPEFGYGPEAARYRKILYAAVADHQLLIGN